MDRFLTGIVDFVVATIVAMGYPGIVALMAAEGSFVPLPSEMILPFAGALCSPEVAAKHGVQPLSLFWVSFWSAFGSAVGAAIAYGIGAWKGRPFIEKYGKYVLIKPKDLDDADRFFQKYGMYAVFFSRVIPVVRTVISFPAGVSRMPFIPFFIFSFLGALPWCFMLCYGGMKVGANWDKLKDQFAWLETVGAALVVLFVVWWVWRQFKPDRPKAATAVDSEG